MNTLKSHGNLLVKMCEPCFIIVGFKFFFNRFIVLNVRRAQQRVCSLIAQKYLVPCCFFPLSTVRSITWLLYLLTFNLQFRVNVSTRASVSFIVCAQKQVWRMHLHSDARVLFRCGTLLTNKQLRIFLATRYSCLFRGGHASATHLCTGLELNKSFGMWSWIHWR